MAYTMLSNKVLLGPVQAFYVAWKYWKKMEENELKKKKVIFLS